MSRCFPFPPPGYEKKHGVEDLDILKEEKRKEKKHKKDKKDKGRKKDKEKKEKDGSSEKRKDKKDRKRKHRDKKGKHRDKKDKEDRSKDKEKSSISEESTVSGKLEEKSAEKINPTGHSKDSSSIVDDRKKFMLYQGQNGVKPSQGRMPSQGTEESKFVRELDRRIYDDKITRSQLPEGVADVDKGSRDTETRATIKSSSRSQEKEKDDSEDTRDHLGKRDLHGIRNEPGGHAMVQNLAALSKRKVEGLPRPLDEQNDIMLEGEEKFRETGDNRRRDKRKERDKISRGNEKDKEKDKKKEEKEKVKMENKKLEKEKLKEVERNRIGGVTSNKSTDLAKDVKSSADGNIRKRKDMDTRKNGFLHESDIGPNKVQRTATHESTENGKRREDSPTTSETSYDKYVFPDRVGMDKVDKLINGIIDAHPSSSKHNPSAAAMVSDQGTEVPKIHHSESICVNESLILSKMENDIAKASRRLPHPDSKYLLEVLTVPNVGDWSENDDQEWLFGKKDLSDKPKLKALRGNDEKLVWAEARYIETADICALPYVIPY